MFKVVTSLMSALLVLLAGQITPSAAPLSGVVQLPRKFSMSPRFSAPGYWTDLRNEVLRIQPPLQDPRTEMVVTLAGSGLSRADQVKPTVRFADMRLVPPVLPVRPNTDVTVHNTGRVTHKLVATADKASEPVTLRSDEKTTVTAGASGETRLSCLNFPHIFGTILVVDAPRFALPDAAGAFRFPDVPDGTYTLKVWFRGRWLHKQQVKVRRKTTVTVQLPASKE